MQARHETFPTATESLLLVIALFFIEYLVALLFYALQDVTGLDPQRMPASITVLGNGILFSFLLAYKRMNYATLFHPAATPVSSTILTLTLPILLIVPGLVLAMITIEALLVSLIPLTSWDEALFEQLQSNSYATLFTVCVVAPFLEEMLFRGIILKSFLKQYSTGRAILLSSLLFGLVHLNIYQFVAGFILGMILGWLYARSRSLWPCITLHMTYNTAIMALNTWLIAAEPGEADTGWVFYWLAAVVASYYGITMLRRLLAIQPRE